MDKLLHIIKKYIPAKLFSSLQPVYHYLLGALAAARYGWPSNKLIVIGITGTTGKTTSIYLISKMLAAAGYKTGFTSTAVFNDGANEWLNDKKMTMPGRFFTQKILRRMVKNNCRYAVVETTSQGIEQFRHRFINYDILIFTGLYPEHIEAHGSFSNYKEAKAKLFFHLRQCKTKYANDKKQVVRAENGFKKIASNRIKKVIIANADDNNAGYFLDFWAEEKISYKVKSIKSKANPPSASWRSGQNSKFKNYIINYGEIKSNSDGVQFTVDDKVKINLRQLGEYNAANAMNAVCLGLSQGISLDKIKVGLEEIKGVPGRMEVITSPRPSPLEGEGVNFTVIVDYAFEPEALKKVYGTILKLEHNKIINVLGSTGGGRDTARRPKLGALAGEQADIVIVTNEDPYDDDPKMIIGQVAAGALAAGKTENKNLFKIDDRREAIRKALALAQAGDIVLITGKGSEQAICVSDGQKIPWDDREAVREELNKIKEE